MCHAITRNGRTAEQGQFTLLATIIALMAPEYCRLGFTYTFKFLPKNCLF